MSQTYNMPMASSDTLSASRTVINDAHDAVLTTFAGSSEPGSFVTGQAYFNTTDKGLYWSPDGVTMYKIFTPTGTYGGLLPRIGGSGYAMTGDLYAGSNKIKNLANPVDSNDAANKTWSEGQFLKLSGGAMTGIIACAANLPTATANPSGDTQLARKAFVDLFWKRDGTNQPSASMNCGGQRMTNAGAPSVGSDLATKTFVDDLFDTSTGHDHDGADAKKVLATNIDTTGASAHRFYSADGAGALEARQVHSDTKDSHVTSGGYGAIVTATAYTYTGQERWIIFGFTNVTSGVLGYQLKRDTTIIKGPATVVANSSMVQVYRDAAAPSDASYDYVLEGNSSRTLNHCFIMVL